MNKLPPRFWSKVRWISICEDGTEPCWLWGGGIDTRGYGQYWLNKTQQAHKLAFLDAGGVLTPKKPWVLHKCHEYWFKDNKACVNPKHLRAGSLSENVQDTIKAGTFKNPMTDLNKLKTHCPRGHELSGDNLIKYQLKLGYRSCKICYNKHSRKSYKKKKLL